MRALLLTVVAVVVLACASLEVLAERSARIAAAVPPATSAPARLEP